MRETFLNALKTLEIQPDHDESLQQIEEIVTTESSIGEDLLIMEKMDFTIDNLSKREEWEVVARLMEAQLCIVPRSDIKKEIQIRQKLVAIFNDELLLLENSIREYKRICELDPENNEAQNAIKDLLKLQEKWEEVANKFIEEGNEATDNSLKATLYYNAAELIYKNKPRKKKEISDLLDKCLSIDPTNYKAIRLYSLLLAKKKWWREIVELNLRGAKETSDTNLKVKLLKEAARILATKAQEKDSAANIFLEILNYVPNHQGALTYLVDYFTEKEEWLKLVELYKQMLKYYSKGESEIATLIQLGMIYWKKLNEREIAKDYFESLRKINPNHPAIISFFKEYYLDTEDWNKFLLLLSDALKTETELDGKIQILRKIGNIAEDKLDNVEKAIEAWKNLLRYNENDDEAFQALNRLYKKGEKWNALLELLKEKIDKLPPEFKEERINYYKEMVKIYRDKLHLDVMVINTYNAILKIKPEDDESLDKLCEIYEQLQRYNDLLRILESKAERVKDLNERKKLYIKITHIWMDKFNNFNKAIQPLEKILEIDPLDKEAPNILKDIYEKRRTWPQLYGLLQKELELAPEDKKLNKLIELANVAITRLNRIDDAIGYYKEVLKYDPDNAESIDNIEKLSERQKDWKELAYILNYKMEKTSDTNDKLQILLKLGTIYESRLEDNQKSVEIWKKVLEIQNNNSKAIRVLKDSYLKEENYDALEELYSSQQDWEGLVSVISETADTHQDSNIKLKLSFRAAEIFEQKINHPLRAQRSYERILSIDPRNERAAHALVDIYYKNEQWNRLANVYEILLEHISEGSKEEIDIIVKLRDIFTDKLSNKEEALKWASKLYKIQPNNKDFRNTLEELIKNTNKWDELIKLYSERLEKAKKNEELLLLERLATIYKTVLGDIDKAIIYYKKILEINPDDENTIIALEEIYSSTNNWDSLISSLNSRLANSKDFDTRKKLYLEIASVYEVGLENIDKSIETYNILLEEQATDEDALNSLERLYSESQKWNELSKILESKVELQPSDSIDINLLIKLGELYKNKTGKLDKALNIYKQIITIDPHTEEAIKAWDEFLANPTFAKEGAQFIIPVLEKEKNYNKLIDVYHIDIAHTSDKEEKLEHLFKLAELYQDKLNDYQKAFQIIAVAMDENPEKSFIWDRLFELAQSSGLYKELAEKFSLVYSRVENDSSLSVILAEKLATLYSIQLEDSSSAEPYYLKMLENQGINSPAFDALTDLYTTQERWEELIKIYIKYVDEIMDTNKQLELLLKICFIYEEILERPVEAIEWYAKVIKIDPHHERAILALERLFEKTERWVEFIDLLTHKLNLVENEKDKIEIQYKLGTLYEEKVDKPELAINNYEAVLNINPKHRPAVEALERLISNPKLKFQIATFLVPIYEKDGEWSRLVEVLTIQLDEYKESYEKVMYLTKIANIMEEKLYDQNGAFNSYSLALLLQPENEELVNSLYRIASEKGFWPEYVSVIEKAIDKLKEGITSPAALLKSLATIYEEKLSDIDKAEITYKRLLDLDQYNQENSIPAINALERIYLSKESWQELVNVLRIKLRFTESPEERLEILFKISQLQEEMLDKPKEAIETYNEIIIQDIKNIKAINALERLYDKTSNYKELINILNEKLNLTESNDERSDIYYRIAELYEAHLNDFFNAISTYNIILKEIGDERRAIKALIRLYEKEEQWIELLEVMEKDYILAEKDEEKIDILFKIGNLYYKKQENIQSAIEKYKEVLSINTNHTETISTLEELIDSSEKLAVAQILAPIYESENKWEKLIKILEIEVKESFDTSSKIKKLLRAAEICEIGLSDNNKCYEYLSQALKEGINEPNAQDIITSIERVSGTINNQKELVELYKKIIPDIYNADIQLDFYLKIARMSFHELKDIESAEEYFKKVIEIQTENKESLDALEEIYLKTENYTEAIGIYKRKTELAQSSEERKVYYLKQAEICIKNLDDIDNAISSFEEVLNIEPLHQKSLIALEELYIKTSNWQKLTDLLEKKIELKEDLDKLYFRLGELYFEKLEDVVRGLEYYEKCLEINKDHQETIGKLENLLDNEEVKIKAASILEPIYGIRMDWNKLVKTLEIRLSGVIEPKERKELLSKISEIFEVQLESLDGAFENYLRMFKEDIEDVNTWEKLQRLAKVLERWEKLASEFEKTLDEVLSENEQTSNLALITAKIYEENCKNIDKAAKEYKKVLTFNPKNEEAFSRIEEMFRRNKRWDDLLGIYKEALEWFYESEEKIKILFKIAKLYEEILNDMEKAIDTYLEVTAIEDQNPDAITNLDRLYYQTSKWTDLAGLLEQKLTNTSTDSDKIEIMFRLGKLYEEKIQDLNTAIDWYEGILRINPEHDQTITTFEGLILNMDYRYRIAKILEPIYKKSDEWKKLVVIYDSELEFIKDPYERLELFLQIAKIHEERGGDLGLAYDALSKAFIENSDNDEVLDKLKELSEKIQQWQMFVDTLTKAVENIYDTSRQAIIWRLISRTHDKYLGDPRKAIDAYKKLLEVSDGDSEALEALEVNYTMVGDWEGQVEILKKKIEFTMEDNVRKELWQRAGSIYEDMIGNEKLAIEAFQNALDLDAQDSYSLSCLERLYENSEDWNKLVEILKSELYLTTEKESKIGIFFKLADIQRDKLNEADEAVQSYQGVLEEDPQNLEAINNLIKLFEKQEKWDDLIDTLQKKENLISKAEDKVKIFSIMGKLLKEKIQDINRAIEIYRNIININQTEPDALSSLEEISKNEDYCLPVAEILDPIYLQNQKWQELISIKERKLNVIIDVVQKVNILKEIAKIYEEKLGENKKAFETYVSGLKEDSNDEFIHEELNRLAKEYKLWEDLTNAYSDIAQNLVDPERTYKICTMVAKVYETELNNIEKAIEYYRMALDTIGNEDPETLSALDRLYTNQEKWKELEEILEREIVIKNDPVEISNLEFRLAQIKEKFANDINGAIILYRSILDKNKDHEESINALEKLIEKEEYLTDLVEILDPLYRQKGLKDKLINLYKIRIDLSSDMIDKINLYNELSEFQQNEIGDFSGARQSLLTAFKLNPEDNTYFNKVKDIARNEEDWTGISQVLEEIIKESKIDKELKIEYGMELGKIYVEKLNELSKAKEIYSLLRDIQSDNVNIVKELESIYRTEGDKAKLIETLYIRVELEIDYEIKKSLLKESAYLSREAGDIDKEAYCWEEFLKLDAENEEALRNLIEIYEKQEKWEKAIELLDRLSSAILDTTEANKLRYKLAGYYQNYLKDNKNAEKVYIKILDYSPEEKNAMICLEQIYNESQNWDELKDILLRRGDIIQDVDEKVSIYESLANLYENQFKSDDDAVDYYKQILDISQSNDKAVENLERLYIKNDKWEDLVDLFNNEIQKAQSRGDSAKELDYLVRLGEIYETKLNSTDKAIEIYEAVLHRAEKHSGALGALARLHAANNEWDKCIKILEQAIDAAESNEKKAKLMMQLASTYEQGLNDNEKSIEYMIKAVDSDTHNIESINITADKLKALSKYDKLAYILIIKAQQEQNVDEKVKLLLEAAQIYIEKLDQKNEAIPIYLNLRELKPQDTAILLSLASVYTDTGRGDDAIPVIRSLIEAEESKGIGRNIKKLAEYRFTLGKALEAKGDIDVALVEYEAAYKFDMTNVHILSSLGEIAYTRGDFEKAVKIFRALLLQNFDKLKGFKFTKADIYFRLGDILRKQGETQKAIGMLQRGLENNPNHQLCKEALAELKK